MGLLLGVLEASIVGGIAVLIYRASLAIFGKKISKKHRMLIWLLILIRLMIPIHFNVLEQTKVIELPVYIIDNQMQMIGSDDKNENVAEKQAYIGKGLKITTGNVITIVWLGGIIAFCGYFGISYLYSCKKLKEVSEVCEAQAILQIFREEARELNVQNIPRVYILENINLSPFTMGIIKQKIFLPDRCYTESHLKYVLRHELCHCKNRDVIIKMLVLIVNAIHWFNPLIWFMRMFINQDIELACDEKVLQYATRAERREYSELIMSFVTEGNTGVAVISTGYVQDTLFLKRRFDNIYDMSEKKLGVNAVMCCLSVFLAIGSGLEVKEQIQVFLWQEVSDYIGESKIVAVVDKKELVIMDDMEIERIATAVSNAYFSGDLDTIKQYLDEPYEWQMDTYYNMEEVDELVLYGLEHNSQFKGNEIGDVRVVYMRYKEHEWDEFYQFLAMELVKREEGWKIQLYGIG